MNGVYGFDNNEIAQLRVKVSTSLTRLGEDVASKLQSEVLDPLMTNWFAPEAVTYLQSLQNTIQSYKQPIVEIYNAYLQTLDSAIHYWGETTNYADAKTHQYQAFSVADCPLNVYVNNAKSENGSQVGMVYSECMNIVNRLPQIRTEVNGAITSAQALLNETSALLGGTQAEEIKNLFTRIGTIINRLFDTLTDGEDSLKNVLNAYVTKYGESVTNVSSSLSQAGQQ